jgi:DNA-binding XRE family transcriptional regulator
MPARRTRDPAAVRQLRDQFAEDIEAGRLDFGTAVKRMREISGLTQEQFAKHRGVSLLTLKRIEQGRGNPTVGTLNRIGQIFALRIGFVPLKPKISP